MLHGGEGRLRCVVGVEQTPRARGHKCRRTARVRAGVAQVVPLCQRDGSPAAEHLGDRRRLTVTTAPGALYAVLPEPDRRAPHPVGGEHRPICVGLAHRGPRVVVERGDVEMSARRDHRGKEGATRNRVVVRPTEDDTGLRVDCLDRSVGGVEHVTDECGRRPVEVLGGVLLVPYLNRRHAAVVAQRESGDECGPVGGATGRVRGIRRGPRRCPHQHRLYRDPITRRLADDRVGARPGEHSALRLEEVPGKLEAHVPRTEHVRVVEFGGHHRDRITDAALHAPP